MLTESKVAKAAPGEAPRKLADGGGLYLLVTPSGGKLWRMNYRYQGKQKTLALGKWPVVSLAMAREAVLEAKRKLAAGEDPSAARKAEAEGLFMPLALEWFNAGAWSAVRRDALWRYLQREIAPVFGQKSITEITIQDVDRLLQGIAQRSVSIARICSGILNNVFLLAVRRGYCQYNPVLMLRGALPSLHCQHHPTLLNPDDIGALLRDFESPQRPLWPHTRLLMRMLPLVFVRIGELRLAEWCEFDFSEKIWVIPKERMKLRREHVVPLSRQVLEILSEAPHEQRYVFSNPHTGKPPGKTTVQEWFVKNYRGIISSHGFRSMARTLLHERLHFSPDAIEAQLAHRVPDRLGMAYNRSQHMEERIRMMQAWADYLDELKKK